MCIIVQLIECDGLFQGSFPGNIQTFGVHRSTGLLQNGSGVLQAALHVGRGRRPASRRAHDRLLRVESAGIFVVHRILRLLRVEEESLATAQLGLRHRPGPLLSGQSRALQPAQSR